MINPVASLNGEEIELVCTYGAARQVSRLANALELQGGPRNLARLAMAGDIDAVSIAITAASGKPFERVSEKVFNQGSGDPLLTVPAAEFFLRLANGGRPLTSGEVSDEQADPQKGKA